MKKRALVWITVALVGLPLMSCDRTGPASNTIIGTFSVQPASMPMENRYLLFLNSEGDYKNGTYYIYRSGTVSEALDKGIFSLEDDIVTFERRFEGETKKFQGAYKDKKLYWFDEDTGEVLVYTKCEDVPIFIGEFEEEFESELH